MANDVFDSEPVTIGLSQQAKAKLERLKADGYFNEMMDAYKFAVALALASNAISPPISNRATFINVGSIDPDRLLYDSVSALRENKDEPVYKTAERLAEWGVNELSAEAESGSINFSAIFEKIKMSTEK